MVKSLVIHTTKTTNMKKTSATGRIKQEGKPKKTRQGKSINTKLSRTPSNSAKKAYRGQG
jgi:hypothetical protein